MLNSPRDSIPHEQLQRVVSVVEEAKHILYLSLALHSSADIQELPFVPATEEPRPAIEDVALQMAMPT